MASFSTKSLYFHRKLQAIEVPAIADDDLVTFTQTKSSQSFATRGQVPVSSVIIKVPVATPITYNRKCNYTESVNPTYDTATFSTPNASPNNQQSAMLPNGCLDASCHFTFNENLLSAQSGHKKIRKPSWDVIVRSWSGETSSSYYSCLSKDHSRVPVLVNSSCCSTPNSEARTSRMDDRSIQASLCFDEDSQDDKNFQGDEDSKGTVDFNDVDDSKGAEDSLECERVFVADEPTAWTSLVDVLDAEDGAEMALQEVIDYTTRFPSGRYPLVPPIPPKLSRSRVTETRQSLEKNKNSHCMKAKKTSMLSSLSRLFCNMPTTLDDEAEEVADSMGVTRRLEAAKALSVSPATTHSQCYNAESSPCVEPIRQSISPLTMPCGRFCQTDNTKQTTVLVNKQKTTELTIGSFLGSPGKWCQGWQSWYMSETMTGDKDDDRKQLQRLLRNRAGNLHARTRRIRQLRDDLSPFEVRHRSTISRAQRSPIALSKKTESFSIPHSSSLDSSPTTPKSNFSESVVSVTTSIWDTVNNCGESETQIRRDYGLVVCDDDQLCYDSDPGEVPSRRAESRKAFHFNRRAVDAFLKKGGKWSKSSHDTCESSIRNDCMREDKHFLSEARIDDGITNVLKVVMNSRTTLVWHRTPAADHRNPAPVAVKSWIEHGSQLRFALIQPRFMWQTVNMNHEKSGKLSKISAFNIHSIELLDISRILEVNRIDRELHPLAKRNCSFVIEAFERTFLFEASCEAVRNRIVHGLKLLVARLGSRIIVGDDAVFEEFFTPIGPSFPGEAPAWTMSKEGFSFGF